MASSQDTALPNHASCNPGVPTYTTMASINAAGTSTVPGPDSEENVKAFIDGVFASAEDDDLAFKATDDDGTTIASIEKAGLFPGSNEISDLRFDTLIASDEAGSSFKFDDSFGSHFDTLTTSGKAASFSNSDESKGVAIPLTT